MGPAGRGGPAGPTPTSIPTTAAGAAAGAGVAPRVTARFNLQKPDSTTLQPSTAIPAAPPSKKARPAPALKAAAHSFRESAGLLRGYALSFRVVFQEPAQRSSRTAATTVIQRALCDWGRKQRLGFTLDVRETIDSLEGIVEGVHNGNVTEAALAALRSKIHELLRRAKRKTRDQALECAYRCSVYAGNAKPEEMITSYIVRNGSRTGYQRLKTTHPDVVEIPQPEKAATVPARDTPAASSGALRPSGLIHSLSDVLAAVEAERENFQNRVAQISSFKDAMVCVGDVVQIVELLYNFLQERAYLEEGGVGPSRGDSRPGPLEAVSGGMVAHGIAAGRSHPSGSRPKSRAAPSPAAAMAGRRSPKQSPKLRAASTRLLVHVA